MSEPISLNGEREKRQPKCEYCGEKAHETEYKCPRIASVVKPDGTEINFWAPDDGEDYYVIDLSDIDDAS